MKVTLIFSFSLLFPPLGTNWLILFVELAPWHSSYRHSS